LNVGKMKNRFTALDVAAAVSNMKAHAVGMRASNIYGINGKTYMIKLHAANQDKRFLLLESGIRVHSTKYMRDKPKIPSVFTLKLRKHIRNKRLEDVRQLGLDRVIDFTFGQEAAAYHLIIELHSKGNVLLTDHEYNIITLLRTYKYKDTGVLIATREKYPVDSAQQFERLSKEQLRELLEGADKSASLKQVLTRRYEFSPALVQHAVLQAELNPNHKMGKWDWANLDRLHAELQKAEEVVAKTQSESTKGWVISRNGKEEVEEAKAKAAAAAAAAGGEGEKGEGKGAEEAPVVAYDSFVPFLYCQFKDRHVVEFDSFDEATDEFFSKTEAQKVDIQRTAQEGVVDKKLAKVKADQTKRIVALEKKEEDCLVQAQLIQENLDDVEKALMIIRSAIANSMDWTDLARIIKEEKKNGDEIAQLIHKLNLEQGRITLLLSGKEEEETDEDQTLPARLVGLDINLSAYANMERYYSEKKASAVKKKKTKAVVSKAMKRAEKKVRKDVQVVQVKKGIQRLRKPFWFEKFYWFLSSEGYVVVSGRDAQQNEMIVKRYLVKGDLYVHADLHGAASVVIKNPSGKAIPPSTLEQAGAFAICRSAAWNAKIITSAWWVYPHQVSKTAPSGEYLTTGSFIIRGKKNFLPPVQLLMGFAVLFRVDETCVDRHRGERRSLAESDGIPSVVEEYDEEAEMAAADRREAEAEAEAEAAEVQERNERETAVEAESEKAETETETERTAEAEKEAEAEAETETETKAETDPEAEAEAEAETETEPETATETEGSGGEEEEEDESSEEEFQPRYAGIQEKYQVEQREEYVESEAKEKIQRSKPRLSAKQRRLLKKGIDPNSEEAQRRMAQAKQRPQGGGKKKTGKGRKAQPSAKSTVPRGKKKKLKKIRTKYADQDEEERRLRMQLLASAGPQKEDMEEAPAEEADDGQEESSGVAAKGRRHQRTPEEIEADQQRREEEALANAKEAMENDSFLDSLTGRPHPEDILVCAIPMCAPYAAVQRYKYRVKLTPGNSKTGASCKAALSAFNKVKEMTDQERAVMKTMSDNEMHQQMVGNARVQPVGNN